VTCGVSSEAQNRGEYMRVRRRQYDTILLFHAVPSDRQAMKKLPDTSPYNGYSISIRLKRKFRKNETLCGGAVIPLQKSY